MLDEVEQAAIGPLEVLEGHDHRAALGDPLEQGAPGGEKRLALASCVIGLRRLEAQQAAQRWLDPLALDFIRYEIGEHGAQLVKRAVALLRLGDSGALTDHLREGPEGDPVAVRGATSLMPVGGLGQPVQVFLQLPGETALAEAGLARDQDEANPALVRGGVVEVLQDAHLHVAADERRLELRAAAGSATPRHDAKRPIGLDRRPFSLQGLVAGRLVGDCLRARLLRGLSHEHAPGRRHRLQARRGVDHVARHHPLALRADGDGGLSG